MRQCAACLKPDRPQIESPGDCNCGSKSLDPLLHDVNCWAIAHEVVQYPVRMQIRDLTFDRQLPTKWHGWKLLQNGSRFYRVKLLCRECIEKQVAIERKKEDYARACRTAKGLDTQTYAQMLASQ